MREELQKLESTYQQLTREQSGVSALPAQREAARRRFLLLSGEARELREQQKRLRAMLHERQLFLDSSRALASEFSGDDGNELAWSAVAHAAFEPLEPARCFEIMRESLEVVQRFEVGGDVVSSGATYFGWKDKRRVDAETSAMHFTFTKPIAARSAEFLMDASWATFCDENKMRRNVFSAGVQVHLEILQVVNADVCVVRRHTKYVAMGRAFHTVYLLFRIQTAAGYRLCFRTVPAPGIQNALEPHEAWIEIFHWCVAWQSEEEEDYRRAVVCRLIDWLCVYRTNFTRLKDANGDDAGAEVEFGGSIGAGVIKFAMHWMLELAMTVVRWENACVAPMAIKPAVAATEGGQGARGAATSMWL
ncbi:hypothetical protein PybrP1_007767 [[Pythium] brassicae (nom. inval.)]|nr:hypothetical protein PybrP1_007767 [[Pythium] brassicae (nom. inval.)]